MFGLTSLEDGPGAIPPFVQGMLQQLLSKEIFYPSLKELVDKYPEWLEEKKTTISSSDLQRFTKQLELMQQVIIFNGNNYGEKVSSSYFHSTIIHFRCVSNSIKKKTLILKK